MFRESNTWKQRCRNPKTVCDGLLKQRCLTEEAASSLGGGRGRRPLGGGHGGCTGVCGDLLVSSLHCSLTEGSPADSHSANTSSGNMGSPRLLHTSHTFLGQGEGLPRRWRPVLAGAGAGARLGEGTGAASTLCETQEAAVDGPWCTIVQGMLWLVE